MVTAEKHTLCQIDVHLTSESTIFKFHQNLPSSILVRASEAMAWNQMSTWQVFTHLMPSNGTGQFQERLFREANSIQVHLSLSIVGLFKCTIEAAESHLFRESLQSQVCASQSTLDRCAPMSPTHAILTSFTRLETFTHFIWTSTTMEGQQKREFWTRWEGWPLGY